LLGALHAIKSDRHAFEHDDRLDCRGCGPDVHNAFEKGAVVRLERFRGTNFWRRMLRV
jgi:hypothetical protein